MSSWTARYENLSRDQLISHIKQMPLRHKFGFLGLFLLAVLPLLIGPLMLEIFIGIIFLMVFAISWDLVSGYTGQISFGHAAFFAIGGYTSAILNIQHGFSPIIGIIVGTLLATIAGFLIGYPALRLKGPYLSLVTLVVPIILLQFTILWNDGFSVGSIPLAPDGLGGRTGIGNPPNQIIGPSETAIISVDNFAQQTIGNYYLAFFLLLFVLAISLFITRSQLGEILTAIRENERTADFAGFNTAVYKIGAFVVSGCIGGFAGAVYVHSMVGYPQPDLLLELSVSINIIIMAIIGGVGTIVGAAVGAFLFGSLEYILSTYQFLGISIGHLNPLPLVLLSGVILKYMPSGVVPASITLGRKIIARIKGEEPSEIDDDRPAIYTIIDNYKQELISKFDKL